jgi:hypothetical protein
MGVKPKVAIKLPPMNLIKAPAYHVSMHEHREHAGFEMKEHPFHEQFDIHRRSGMRRF